MSQYLKDALTDFQFTPGEHQAERVMREFQAIVREEYGDILADSMGKLFSAIEEGMMEEPSTQWVLDHFEEDDLEAAKTVALASTYINLSPGTTPEDMRTALRHLEDIEDLEDVFRKLGNIAKKYGDKNLTHTVDMINNLVKYTGK